MSDRSERFVRLVIVARSEVPDPATGREHAAPPRQEGRPDHLPTRRRGSRRVTLLALPTGQAARPDRPATRHTATSRTSSIRAAERATTDSLRQQLRAYRSEIARLRLENQALREQLAHHLGAQRAAVNTSPI